MPAQVPLEELDLPDRATRSRPRVAALAAALGARPPELEDGALRAEGTVTGSGRPFSIVARLEADLDRFEVVGEVSLEVELDNRLGHVMLVHDDEPDLERMSPVGGALFAHGADPELREGMVELMARAPGMPAAIEDFLRSFERYGIELFAGRIVAAVGDLDDDDEDWRACVADVANELLAIDAIARRVEALPLLEHATCAYCGARFLLTTRSRCLHCGAPI
jgi:hypothetical protein